MVRPANAVACLLAATGGADALRAKTEARDPVDDLFATPYRQMLRNFWDLQYVGDLTIGGQKFSGVLDTGSFDVVVFSKACSTCGVAKAYEEGKSPKMRRGQRRRTQNYGSGSCTSVDVKDEVVVGGTTVPSQDMWVAQDCNMPLLGSASFNAIVGIGPPGHLGKVAMRKLAEQKKLEEEYTADGVPVPKSIQDGIARWEEDVADSATKLQLLDGLGSRTFSSCYGRHPGEPGVLVWNDATRKGEPGVTQVPVKGQLTWGVQLDAVGLVESSGKHTAKSCQSGCGAIVDTGTSLIGVPSVIYNRIVETLSPDSDIIDCSNINDMPRLLISIDGKPFYLPPTAYVGKMYGSLSSDALGFMRRTGGEEKDGQCSLLLMDMGNQKTQLGPMFILGIPFMREFYTTFDLGTGPDDRSLFLSASSDCQPGQARMQEFREPLEPMRVDASKIRVPHWLKHRSMDII